MGKNKIEKIKMPLKHIGDTLFSTLNPYSVKIWLDFVTTLKYSQFTLKKSPHCITISTKSVTKLL
jgi:hypothetical protein